MNSEFALLVTDRSWPSAAFGNGFLKADVHRTDRPANGSLPNPWPNWCKRPVAVIR
jgi:hypothetical protein